MQRGMTPNIHILCTLAEHLSKMNIKAKQAKESIWLERRGKRGKKLKSWSQLISENYQVSGPLLQKERESEKNVCVCEVCK